MGITRHWESNVDVYIDKGTMWIARAHETEVEQFDTSDGKTARIDSSDDYRFEYVFEEVE